MKIRKIIQYSQIFILGCIFSFIFVGFGKALAATTQWHELGGGKARLIAVKNPETNTVSGIIDVQLNKGWKTYWRSSGSSGIPPEFNFGGSQNIQVTKIEFPVPKWLTLPGAQFYGYKDRVQFVFEGETYSDNSQLQLDMLIGVCEEICIPATANFTISQNKLNQSDPKANLLLKIASNKLPKPATKALRVTQGNVEKDHINIVGTYPQAAAKIDVVFEQPMVWISDPLTVKKNSNGSFSVFYKLPGNYNMKDAKNVWNYSILSHDDDTGEKVKVFEGQFTPQ